MKPYFYSFSIIFLLCSCEQSVNNDNSYDYSIEQQLGCFCPRGGEWVKLFVKADTIANAVVISDGSQLPFDEWKRYKTINGLYQVISKVDTSIYALKTTIDSVGNYPSYVYFNPKPVVHGDTVQIITDAQMVYTTKNYIKHH